VAPGTSGYALRLSGSIGEEMREFFIVAEA
jgi:hypothetical protein